MSRCKVPEHTQYCPDCCPDAFMCPTCVLSSPPTARAASTGCVGTGCGLSAWNIRTMDTYVAEVSYGGPLTFEYMHKGKLMRIDRAFPHKRCTADEAIRAEVSCG